MTGSDLLAAINAYFDEQERNVGGGYAAEHNQKLKDHEKLVTSHREQLTLTVEALAVRLNTPALWRLTNWLRRRWNPGDFPGSDLIVAACAELDEWGTPSAAPTEIDPVVYAIALLFSIGPNKSEISKKIGVPRTSMTGPKWASFNHAYEQAKQGRRP